MHELLAAILLLVDRDSEHLREFGPEVETSEAEAETRYSEADLRETDLSCLEFLLVFSFFKSCLLLIILLSQRRREMEMVMAREYRDADAFNTFLCLMKNMKPFFESDHYVRPQRSEPPPRVHLPDGDRLFPQVRSPLDQTKALRVKTPPSTAHSMSAPFLPFFSPIFVAEATKGGRG